MSESKTTKRKASSDQKTAVKVNIKKWGPAMMAAGYTIVPNVLLERQSALGIDSVDLNILLLIVAHWWKADNRAFLSKATIAETFGCSPRTVQRRISEMKREGILKTVDRFTTTGRQTANAFDLGPLIQGAKPLAEELLAERKARALGNRARAMRKRPRRAVGANSDEAA